MITEEKIVDMAYTAAEKLYNMNYNGMKSLSIDKDDFMQDAVMYILDLYRKDYMHLDIESKAPGMVMKMLKTFVLNLFQVTNKKQNKKGPSLDLELTDSENNQTLLDIIPDHEQDAEALSKITDGKQWLEDIVNELDVSGYTQGKHKYVGNDKILGSDLKFSEHNIGKLLLQGYNTTDILHVYDAYASNIGASSRATIVNRKVNNVINKIADVVNSLGPDEIEAVKLYLTSSGFGGAPLDDENLVSPEDFDPAKVQPRKK